MRCLILNAGRYSLKYLLTDLPEGRELSAGEISRVGQKDSCLSCQVCGHFTERTLPASSHQDAVDIVASQLEEFRKETGEPDLLIFRLPMAASGKDRVIPLDVSVAASLEQELFPPGPYGAIASEVISRALELWPGIPARGVYDNGFFQDMPPVAYTYALPLELCQRHGIRKYGFHGLSHQGVLEEAGRILDRNTGNMRIISCHLGCSSSVAAIYGNRGMDCSMGFSPLSGIPSLNRCGDIDPALLPWLMDEKQMPLPDLVHMLSEESGLMGLAGPGRDIGEVLQAAGEGSQRANLSVKLMGYRIRHYIGQFAAVLGGIDLLIFTGGLGTGSARIRQEACRNLDFLGIRQDPEKNSALKGNGDIAREDAPVRILVLRSSEEMQAALAVLRDNPPEGSDIPDERGVS